MDNLSGLVREVRERNRDRPSIFYLITKSTATMGTHGEFSHFSIFAKCEIIFLIFCENREIAKKRHFVSKLGAKNIIF